MKARRSGHPPFRRRDAIVLIALTLLLASTAAARSLRVTKFSDTIHVDEDGSARGPEQITYVFNGQCQGVYRIIPVDYPGPRGTNFSLFLKIISITDESGTALKYDKKTSR